MGSPVARIRTIKPEFVESESIGKLSRDARLLFVLLWTIVDDEGRSRASSRFLASRLFPYDNDAVDLIGMWRDELVAGGHVRLYECEGDTYLDIPKWLKHQKIDHASKSRLPAFSEDLASPRETVAPHTLDLGPSTKDLGPRTIQGANAPGPPLHEAVEIYNTVAEQHGWSKVQRITPARKTALTARLRECGDLDGFRHAMTKAGASGFLTGRVGRSREHESWRPDFDFLMTQRAFTKLMEGKYDDPTGQQAASATGLSAVLSGIASAGSG